MAKVLFYDSERPDHPLTFRDVFLESSALENIFASMVISTPNEAEVSLMLELCGLCFLGEPEAHQSFLKGIQDLGQSMGGYGELLIKKQDLLLMVSDAVSGLKQNAEAVRLRLEALRLEAELASKLQGVEVKRDLPAALPSEGRPPQEGAEKSSLLASESDSLLHLVCQLVEVSRQRRKVELSMSAGDTEDSRHAKVERMKRMVDELKANEKVHKSKASESRKHKTEAITFRGTKAQEVQEREKVIAADMQVLQKRRAELEAELHEVLTAIGVQTQKHLELQEEKEKFDEASTNLVAHLTVQEDELSKLISQHSLDCSLAAAWRSFLEDTWLLQTGCQQLKEQAANDALERSQQQLWKIALSCVLTRMEELDALLAQLKSCAAQLAEMEAASRQPGAGEASPRASLSSVEFTQRKYLNAERKVKASVAAVEGTLSVLTTLAGDAAAASSSLAREWMDAGKLAAVSARVAEARQRFEAVKRPVLTVEIVDSLHSDGILTV